MAMSKSMALLLLVISMVIVPSVSHPIKKVVVLMMENRSFDHLLGWLKEVDSRIDGLTSSLCNHEDVKDTKSKLICVDKKAPQVSWDDPLHDLNSTTEQIFGRLMKPSEGGTPRMDGFVQNAVRNKHHPLTPMSMFTKDIDSAPIINTLAQEFAVFDQWHCSLPGPTDPNRAFFMSGTSRGITHNFDGQLWKQQSYFNFLTERNVSWNAYYDYNPWAIFYFEDVHRPENHKKIFEMEEFFRNVEKGQLAEFTLLQPKMSATHTGPPNWQHPDASVREGERLIKKVYETLRNSKYWEELAFVLTYDEHGGFYDHVTPPQNGVPNPDDIDSQYGFKFDRLGIRVPAIVSSPWIPKGTVVGKPTGPEETSQYESTSVMSTVNKIFGIKEHLSKRAAWSGTFEDVFSLDKPRTDCPTHLPDLPSWTLQDVLEQGQKPLNDHLEIEIQFYCKFNGHDENCGKDIINQQQATAFFDTEIPIYMNRVKEDTILSLDN